MCRGLSGGNNTYRVNPAFRPYHHKHAQCVIHSNGYKLPMIHGRVMRAILSGRRMICLPLFNDASSITGVLQASK